MENVTKPMPPYKSEGCFNCGQRKEETLFARTIRGLSVALCSWCWPKPDTHIAPQPFNARSGK